MAIVLSGLGPGAGHAYVGRPLRGAIFVFLLALSAVSWILAIPRSYDAARLFALPLMLLLLATIVDSGRLARRSPRAPLRPWQRAWTYAGIVALTGFLAPTAFAAWLERRVAIVQAPDDSMDPAVVQGDWLVLERTSDLADVPRGEVVAVARDGRTPLVRRLVGLPGETVSVRRGVAEIDGIPLPAALARPLFAHDLTLDRVRLGAAELLVLGDRRGRDEAPECKVPSGALLGRAAWILLPADLDALRIGAKP